VVCDAHSVLHAVNYFKMVIMYSYSIEHVNHFILYCRAMGFRGHDGLMDGHEGSEYRYDKDLCRTVFMVHFV
jgi:hypothetical protein